MTDSNTNIESLYNQALSYRNKFAFASYLFLGTFDKELLEKIYEQLDVTKREYEKQVASYLKTRKNKTNIDICLVKRQSLDEIIEVEKMCFYECQNVCFNPYKLTQISKRLHLSLKDLMEKVESYYSYLCSINSSSINSFLLNYQKNSIKTKFSNAISLAKIEEDGKLYEEHAYFKKIHEMPIETAMQLLLFKYGFNPSKIFEDYNLKIAKIDSYINTTLKNVREETQQNIITDILEKEIKFAIDVCAITGNGLENGSNLVLDAIKNLVEEYVNGDYISKKDFCFRKKISISIFNSCLKYTEKYLPEIYQLYNNKNKKEENVRYAIVKNKTDKIVKLIKQGIELPDGSIRAFTITDYFFITSLTKEEFMNLSGNLSISDKRLIVPFFKNIADAPKVIVSNELKETTKYIYNINGALYEATEEDKISVLDYMKKIIYLY